MTIVFIAVYLSSMRHAQQQACNAVLVASKTISHAFVAAGLQAMAEAGAVPNRGACLNKISSGASKFDSCRQPKFVTT